jgi:catechol 2,3-dioxygenase-like lactoylglutathione lyase family enzyme
MLDHVFLGVTDLERSRRFYDAALRPLGLVRILDFEGRGSDYGAMPGQLGVEFTITAELSASPPLRVCTSASVLTIGKRSGPFIAAALRAGGRDDGTPGTRPVYHPDYYAAFILDPVGHRIEAV